MDMIGFYFFFSNLGIGYMYVYWKSSCSVHYLCILIDYVYKQIKFFIRTILSEITFIDDKNSSFIFSSPVMVQLIINHRRYSVCFVMLLKQFLTKMKLYCQDDR